MSMGITSSNYANQFKPGAKVHYTIGTNKHFNGIIKNYVKAPVITEVFVVYDCANNWHLYKEYTGVRTKMSDLRPGWIKTLDFRLNSLIKKSIQDAHRDS